MPEPIEVDVAVLGFGLAGANAAIAAQEAGAEVAVFEKMPQAEAGGNTRVSGQALFLPRDAAAVATYQRNLNAPGEVPEDYLQWWAEEMVALEGWLKPLVTDVGMHLVTRAIPTYAELPDLDREDSWVPLRTIVTDPTNDMESSGVWEAFRRQVEKRPIAVHYECRARELIVEDDQVVGVWLETPEGRREVRARGGVVVCVGGYEANPAMQMDLHGTPRVRALGTPANTGDGIRMLQKVGADLWHVRNPVQSGGFWPSFVGEGHTAAFMRHTKLPAYSWIDIAEDGFRFCDETRYWNHTHYREKRHGVWRDSPYSSVGRVHMIFDEATRLSGPLVLQRLTWDTVTGRHRRSEDNSAEIEAGWITRADTLEELAVQIGRDPGRLRSVVERYNAGCEVGEDGDFGREPGRLAPIVEGPFYAVEVVPGIVMTTGGARRDQRSQVLDPAGRPITGLYEAGECGSSNANLYQSGVFLTEAMISGRAAGVAAAERAIASA